MVFGTCNARSAEQNSVDTEEQWQMIVANDSGNTSVGGNKAKSNALKRFTFQLLT